LGVDAARALSVVVGLVALGAVASAEPVSAAATKSITTIDALDVEAHWPAGVHVAWRTGIPTGVPETSEGTHTHCSAFVAAAAEQLGVYILRPPEHGAKLLANAQSDWLGSVGEKQGWRRLRDGIEAQASANRGLLVVAVYRNHHDDKPGHIAIVRPMDKRADVIAKEGPQITQAGGTNYRSTSLERGFRGHPAAFGGGEVAYYAHVVAP
jgi:hypothetical protein